LKHMKKKTSRPLSLLLAAVFALLQFSGCDGIPEPSPAPGASSPEAPSPFPSLLPSATPAASPSPSAAPSPSPEPSASPSVPSDTATATPDATESPTEPPTPSPGPTASPAPWPSVSSHLGDRPEITVLKYYESAVPAGMLVDLEYTKYAAYPDYLVVLKSASVKELPNSNSKTLKSVKYSNRLPLLAQVQGADGKSVWYRVSLSASSVGYIAESAVSVRRFQLDQALTRAMDLRATVDLPATVRISDYNNKPLGGKKVMSPKLPGGKTVDPFGVSRDQSAPAYLAPDKTSSFRYAPDGMLGRLLGTDGDFSAVYFPFWDEVRYVPSTYVEDREVDTKTEDVIKTLTQAVVVDRKNQNIIVLELRGEQWTVISMCYVSTGKKGGYYQPTPLGAYFTDKRPLGTKKIGEFWYIADGANENDPNLHYEGYAPWAIRFCSGAYLHGLPVDVSYDENDKLIFTGRTYESASFLGVSAESHMCVRNYTSHAKFMYQWEKDGQAAVIVID
jgi:hypothetical protein